MADARPETLPHRGPVLIVALVVALIVVLMIVIITITKNTAIPVLTNSIVIVMNRSSRSRASPRQAAGLDLPPSFGAKLFTPEITTL